MDKEEATSHYQQEDSTSGCLGMAAGFAGIVMIVIITIIALLIVTHPGF